MPAKRVIPAAPIVARVVDGEAVHVRVCPVCREEIAETYTLKERPKQGRKPQDRETPLFDGVVSSSGFEAHYRKGH